MSSNKKINACESEYINKCSDHHHCNKEEPTILINDELPPPAKMCTENNLVNPAA